MKSRQTCLVLRRNWKAQLLIRAVFRAESHGTDHKFVGVPVYRTGGVVGRRESDIKGQVLSC